VSLEEKVELDQTDRKTFQLESKLSNYACQLDYFLVLVRIATELGMNCTSNQNKKNLIIQLVLFIGDATYNYWRKCG